MRSEIDSAKDDYWKKISAEGKGLEGDAKKEYWKKARQDWKQKEADIRARHEGMIGESTGDGSNVSSTASGDTAASDIGPVVSGEGNVTVIPKYTEQMDNIQKGVQEGVPHISSGDKDNIYALNTQIENNMLIG